MKRIYLTIVSATLLLTGCTQDFNEPTPNIPTPDDAIAINIGGSIDQVPTTRVNDEGFCDGDGVGIYVVNYNSDVPGTMLSEGNQADNVHYVYNESENKWIPDYPIYYYDKVTPVDIIGYYPYVSNVDNVNAYSFEVAKDQSTDAANGLMGGYEASDFLWGKAEKISPTASRVNVTFHHKMAGVQIYLSEGTGWGENEWNAVDKQVLVTNTIRKATINLSNGDITPAGDVPTTGTVPAVNNGDWRAVVVPQSVGASVALFNITVDGTSYIFRKSEQFEYTSGKLHKFTIEVSKKGDSGLEFKLVGEDITPWESETITHDGTAREYVVINVPAASTDGSSALKTAIETSGKDYTKIKNLKVTGEVDAIDFYFMRDEMSVLQGVNMKEANVVDKKIPNEAFRNKYTLSRFIFPSDIIGICDWSFENTSLSGYLNIPDGCQYIESYVFSNCTNLTSFYLPNSIESIGRWAFFNCNSLQGQLHLPSSLTNIGSNAFAGCSMLSGTLDLPESLEYIGKYAFQDLHLIRGDLIIPSKITSIEGYTFAGCGFDGALILHNGITKIGPSAFLGVPFSGELVLPNQLVTIEDDAFRATNFSGELVLPESLVHIGRYAFAGCSRLSGTIIFPSDVNVVNEGVFYGCRDISKLVLHRNIEVIKGGAWENCYQLNYIICQSIVPPTLDASAFNGVAKDNFIVEVPEASVADYTLAPNWKEFKRIAAHREFSINRNLVRTLNAVNSKTLILRAESGAAWSVESCPDWVTVTPSSGVGKAKVTITINEMTAGDVAPFDVEVYDDWGSTATQTYNGRSGEVVFLLDGKDYRSRTKVEQYDYTYGDGDVITNQTATVGNGVNIVFMGDCFDAQDIATGKYINGINEAIEHFFAVEPYKTYRDYFNVYTVFGLSPDSGMGTANTIREAKFGSQYMLNEGVQTDGKVCFEYACKTPTVIAENICQTPIVLIENSYEYDGVTQMWDDGTAIAIVPMSVDEYPYDFRGLVQHEVGGHAFGKLGDEYIYHNAFITSCPFGCGDATPPVRHAHSLGWFQNLWLNGNMDDVPWSHLIFDEKYQNTVDIYEGGYMHTRGCFRSEQNSCMNNNIPYFSAISRQVIVERIMEYAGLEFSFEEWKAKDKGIYTGSTSSATRMAIEPSVVVSSGVSRQQPPKFMGEKPELNF